MSLCLRGKNSNCFTVQNLLKKCHKEAKSLRTHKEYNILVRAFASSWQKFKLVHCSKFVEEMPQRGKVTKDSQIIQYISSCLCVFVAKIQTGTLFKIC
jgi:hypothetical protein